MRIVFVSYVYKDAYDDPEAWLKRIDFFTGILEQIAAHAEVMAIYNIKWKGKLERNGVTYLFPEFRSMRWPFTFNNYILSLKPDAVVIQGLSPLQIFLLARKHRELKIFVQHRAEIPFTGLKKVVQQWADGLTRKYFFSSKELARDWLEDDQITDAGKICEMIGMSSVFRPGARRAESSQVFLWVGDLDHNKNPKLAVKAFASFSKNHPGAKLFLIYRNGDLEHELKPNASDNILFVGSVDHSEMGNWYNRADFILSTSYYESVGMSICEGMSCGCIPVVTDIPSFRMMTEHGAVGVLYKSGDEKALVDALEKCMSIDVAEMRTKIIESFERRLSFDANARLMIEAVTQGS